MIHASLFSGIGGFDLAAEWMGWENAFHCENNPFCQQILNYYWPNAFSYGNIKESDFTIHRGRIDVLTGGFPCQPYSVSGKRLGKDDERHLWPEMLRAIREIQPPWVVGENVRGLINWNKGLVFDEVQADLEAIGYEVTPFILPACAINAPHRRDRIWFVAKNTDGNGWNGNLGNSQSKEWEQRNTTTGINERIPANNDKNGLITNANSERKGKLSNESGKARTYQSNELSRFSNRILDAANANGIGLRRESNRFGKSRFIGKENAPNDWQNFPTQSPICGGNDGLSYQLDGITFSDWRKESLKGYGNAIVPKLALQIFQTIADYDHK